MRRLWVLGAPDPEMERIEADLSRAGESYEYATKGCRRVRPSEAYGCDPVRACESCDGEGDCDVYLVECAPRRVMGIQHDDTYTGRVIAVDHHRPGDPGYGLPPEEFFRASSIGQVCHLLGLEPTGDILLAAASDHCPAAAYRGLCPGIDPDELMRWRIECRARFFGVTTEDLLSTVDRAIKAILDSPTLLVGGVEVRDIRSGFIPEAPEASLRLGVPILSVLETPDGRTKISILGDHTGDAVKQFLSDADRQGLSDVYGDPARGFAGGYLE